MSSSTYRSASVDSPPTQGVALLLLAKRARIALWVVVASNAFFAITDLRLDRDAMAQVVGLKLLQVGTVVIGLWALRRVHSHHGVVAIVLFSAACISALTAWSGALADDIVTTMILWIAVPFATAAALPWGTRAQLGLVAIAGLAMLLNVYLEHGTLALALGYPSVGILVTLGISVVLTHEFARQRRVLAEENLKRAHAEDMLRQAHDSLEHRVRERTGALELANARLQEAHDAARELEHRFRTVSKLTSDYAYCFRIEADFTAVNEWLTEPSFERVTGYSVAEVMRLGGGVALVHVDDRAVAAHRLQRLLAGHADVSEFRIIRKDGSVRWIREHGYAEWDAAHTRVVRIFGAAQDITERKHEQERTTTLLEVARDISGQLDLHAILERVQRRTAALLPCDMVATFYWNAERDGFCLVSHYGVPLALQATLEALSFPVGAPLGGRVAAGESVVLADVRQLPELGPLLPEGTLIAAPLHVRGRHLGALVTLKTGDQPFDPAQVALCEGIAAQLAVALEGAELYQSQRDESHVSSALARVGQALIASPDTPHLLQGLCDGTAEVFACDGSFALLWEPAENAYVVAAGHGLSDEQWESLRILRLPADTLAGLVDALEAEEVIAVDVESAPTRWALLPARFGFSLVLYVPLRRGSEMVGVLGAAFRGRRPAPTLPWKRIGRGITQLTSFALEQTRATEAIAEASRLKSEFVATMSHELRTPLNIMLGYNEMLLQGAIGPLSPKQTEILLQSDQSARELLQLITDTLDLSRLEVGPGATSYSDVSVVELIGEIEVETRALCTKPHVRVVWEVAENLPHLRTDPGKLKVIVKNLFTNALKFTDAGTITLRVHSADTQLEICVEDTGIGISASALAFIFEPFRQGDSSMTRRHGGVGLGLYIVRRLLDLLGGSIDVTSTVGMGTTFRVRLPLPASEELIAA